MKKKWIAIVGSGAFVVGIVVAGVSFAESKAPELSGGSIKIGSQSEAQFPSMAKITMEKAVKNALAAVSGQVLKAELEEEDGFLVYGVEVATADKTIREVKVDAGSGKVLAMNKDTVDENRYGGYRDRNEDVHEHEGDQDVED